MFFVLVTDAKMRTGQAHCESVQSLHHYTFFQAAFFGELCYIICNVSELCFHQPLLSFNSKFFFLTFFNFQVFPATMSSFASTSSAGHISDFSRNISFLLLEVLSSDETRVCSLQVNTLDFNKFIR